MKSLPFLSIYLLVPVMLASMWLGGVATWLMPVVLFVALPLIDVLVGLDTGETTSDGPVGPLFDGLLRAWVVVVAVLHVAVLSHVTTQTLAPWELAGLLVAMALLSATGSVNIGHELMHRKGRLDRGIAELLMQSVCYPHFCIEHVRGHHRNVATPLDPATARRGESLYAFVPRSIVGGATSAVRLERKRCQGRGIPWWSPQHRITRYALGALVLHGAVALAFGPSGWAFFLLQGIGASMLLETINYIEHYGLERREVAPGRYERVAPRHSWNTNYRVTNWWLFNLQRHADHHAHASRPYYRLRAIEEGPQLPLGYPTMLLLSLVPPLWRAVMDPRVDAAREEAREAVA